MDQNTSWNWTERWSVLFGDVGNSKPRNIKSQIKLMHMLSLDALIRTVESGFGGLSWGWFGIVRRGGRPTTVPH